MSNRDQPLVARVEYLTNLLRTMVDAIVEGDSTVIEVDHNPRRVQFTCWTRDRDDKALLIGRTGVTANAIRNVLHPAARKLDLHVDFDLFCEDERTCEAPVESGVSKGHQDA